MQDETWQARGVEIDNHQVREFMEKLDDIRKQMDFAMAGPYERFLLAALPGLLARGLEPEEACEKAHKVAQIMTADD